MKNPLPASEKKDAFSLSYLYPAYWGTWIFIFFMRLSVFLPFSIQVFIGKQIGIFLYLCLKKRKKITRTNIALCFPELENQQITALSKRSFENMGISIFETAMAWWASDHRLKKIYTTTNLKSLENLLNEKKALIIFSAHFSSTDIGGRFLNMHCNYQAMFKPAKNKLFNYFMNLNRSKHYTMVKNNETKQFLRNLKNGTPSWYAPDQNLKSEDHRFISFFNVPTLSITASSRIAKLTKAKAIAYYPIRRGCRYEIVFSEEFANFPCDDIDNDLELVNQKLEAGIRIDPSQYLWAHKRFHILPDGSERQYQ